MIDERKQTIINEIQYWKKNKLLPSEYCDFLLALYTQGDGEEFKGKDKASRNKRRRVGAILMLAVILIMLPLSFLVIYFTEMDMIMQTGLLSTFVAVALLYSWRLRRSDSEKFHLPLIVGLLIALLLSVAVVHQYLPNNWSVYGVLSAHCGLWALIGWRMKLPYLLISSSIGIIVMVVLLVS
ncbi:hypothetical protein LCM20_05595 [Halobacillus litoralis]|uniref:hypothetical protein n=1 Tax=Halobacillus litoralis TaxID=45668 RepID=UPI001CD3ADE5|nr:hypothetical protein [Halobacillus litoralis]MCA0970055.1 hypothetical protein [Halobacillus litoralis]